MPIFSPIPSPISSPICCHSRPSSRLFAPTPLPICAYSLAYFCPLPRLPIGKFSFIYPPLNWTMHVTTPVSLLFGLHSHPQFKIKRCTKKPLTYIWMFAYDSSKLGKGLAKLKKGSSWISKQRWLIRKMSSMPYFRRICHWGLSKPNKEPLFRNESSTPYSGCLLTMAYLSPARNFLSSRKAYLSPADKNHCSETSLHCQIFVCLLTKTYLSAYVNELSLERHWTE